MKGGRIIDYGQSGKGMIGSTTLRLGPKHAVFQAVALPDLRPAPEVTATTAMFVQTCGGRTGVPAPRRVRRAPFVQFSAPLAWTTLGLEIHADGSCEHHLLWASPFPPHWVYDGEGKLIKKSGLIDFSTWYRGAFGKHSPWGDQDPPAFATEVETALERQHGCLRQSLWGASGCRSRPRPGTLLRLRPTVRGSPRTPATTSRSGSRSISLPTPSRDKVVVLCQDDPQCHMSELMSMTAPSTAASTGMGASP